MMIHKPVYDKLSVAVLLLLGLLSIQCKKTLGCAESVYNFELGIKAYPDQDIINMGDTLWLEIDAATIQTDLQSGRMIDYSRADNLGTVISFAKLNAVDVTNDQVANNFKYVLVQGHEVLRSDTAKYREFVFSETNGFYRFILGIIPIEKGVYKLFVSSASNVYRLNDKCTKANFWINFEGTNQHLYFNEVSFPGITLLDKNGIYLFKVQ